MIKGLVKQATKMAKLNGKIHSSQFNWSTYFFTWEDILANLTKSSTSYSSSVSADLQIQTIEQ